MNRPSFRMGLALGLLGGAAAAVSKALQGRREVTAPTAPAPSTDWPPLGGMAPSPVAATPAPAPSPASPMADVPDLPVADVPDPASAAPVAPASRVTSQQVVAQPARPDTGSNVTDPEPEAVLADEQVEAAAREDDRIGSDDPVPPAPQPTYGTAPDPDAAAAARVPVATPIEVEEDEPLPVPAKRTPPPPPAVKPAATPAKRTARTTSTGATSGKRAPAARKAPAKAAEKASEPWVAPASGTCPGTHPVKAKLSSRIFHLPGMFAYDRTNPDRCYVDAAAAEADGLRSAKR